MNTFLWLFLNLFLFSLKTHWFLLFTTYDSPDFLLLLLILYALDQGGRKGALYGIGMGLFLDVVSFGYFGYHLVTRALVGAFIGSNRMNVFADRMPTYMILTALVTLLLGVAGPVSLRHAPSLDAFCPLCALDTAFHWLEPHYGPSCLGHLPKGQGALLAPPFLLLSSVTSEEGYHRAE